MTYPRKSSSIQPRNEAGKARFSTVVHWAYGTSWGGLRGALAGLGLRGPAGAAAHFGAVWGSKLVVLPALDVAPPLKKWGRTELAIDAWHHLVYAAATSIAYAVLDDHSSARS